MNRCSALLHHAPKDQIIVNLVYEWPYTQMFAQLENYLYIMCPSVLSLLSKNRFFFKDMKTWSSIEK